jgi:hypothetical protein
MAETGSIGFFRFCIRTLKRGTRVGVHAIHGMRRQEHVVDYGFSFSLNILESLGPN